MDPVIKWPGGKSRELSIIMDELPKFKRFFEPFFGGGAVGFNIEPESGHVNDVDKLLIQFYLDIQTQSEVFHNELESIHKDWKLIEQLIEVYSNDFKNFFPNRLSSFSDHDFNQKTIDLLDINIKETLSIISGLSYVEPNLFNKYLKKSINSKLSRIEKLQIKEKVIFDNIMDHLHTAIKSAYYTVIRNEYFNKTPSSANFYFIREFCYGSMFRFNSKGKFNIPYGGINYNTKDFYSKIKNLKSEGIISVFKNIHFYNLDFEDFFGKFEFTKNDFIFLDPPYDSDFKNYGKNPFGEDDQKRLATTLAKCKAKWLLVIQRTDLIYHLYKKMSEKNSMIKILSYDKQYTYNVRGRNDRDTSHLLIKNY